MQGILAADESSTKAGLLQKLRRSVAGELFDDPVDHHGQQARGRAEQKTYTSFGSHSGSSSVAKPVHPGPVVTS